MLLKASFWVKDNYLFSQHIEYHGGWWPGACFIKVFLPAIQIRWKLRLAITPLVAIRSQQIFAHATTAQLPFHVQNFVAITVLRVEVRVKRNFRRIWIAMEKTLVKRGPGPSCDESNQVISSHGIELICAWYSSWSWNIMHKLVQYHG